MEETRFNCIVPKEAHSVLNPLLEIRYTGGVQPRFNNISDKMSVAILFGIIVLSFAIWKSPVLQPKTDTYTSATSASKGLTLTETEAINRAQSILERSSSVKNSTENKTDVITQKIINAYLQAKQQDTYNKSSVDTAIAKATKEQFASPNITPITSSDINIVNDSAQRQQIYKTRLQTVLKTLTTINEYELTTYGRAVSTKDSSNFTKLSTDASIYKQTARTLMTMRVPRSAGAAHLAVINSFLAFAQTLDALSKSENDPMQGLVALRNFMEEEDAIRNAYNQLYTYFILNSYSS